MTAAVFFDVDFTLIYPGPTFRGEGYRRFGERHGLALDESKFEAAVRAAAPVLDAAQGDIYDPAIFHQYTASIIEAMGGAGPGVQPCAVEVYEEWALHHHFEMYDDVPDVLRAIAARGIKIGLISNSHRPLTSFQSHFDLDGLVSATVSSSEHGYLKPHPSIFNAALQLIGVEAKRRGDGRRQPGPGRRRRALRRHARRARAPWVRAISPFTATRTATTASR